MNYWDTFTIVKDGEDHLGGNLRHGDTNSITPVLCRYLVDRFAVKSVLDIGSGEGYSLNIFHRLGVIAHGIDGLDLNVKSSKHPVALHDLSVGPYIYPCDLVYCVEVVEHIKEKFVDNLLATMCNAPIIVMTHGLPGQPGHHHVNNKPQEYWVEKLEAYDYILSIDNDRFVQVAKKENPDSYFAKSGLVFLRKV